MLHPNPYRNITEGRKKKPVKVPSPYREPRTGISATDAEIRYLNQQCRIADEIEMAQLDAEQAAASVKAGRIQQELKDADRLLNPKYNKTFLKCPMCDAQLYRNSATIPASFYCKSHGTIECQSKLPTDGGGEQASARLTVGMKTKGTTVVATWPRIDPSTGAAHTIQSIKEEYGAKLNRHPWYTPPDGSCLCHSIQKQFPSSSRAPSLQQMRSAMHDFLTSTVLGQSIASQHYEDDTRVHHSIQHRIDRVLYRDQYCSYMEIKALVNIYNLKLTIHEICSPGAEGDLSSLQQWDVVNTTYVPNTQKEQAPLEMHVLLAALHYETFALSRAPESISFQSPSRLPRPLIDTNEYTPAALKATAISKQALLHEQISFSCESTMCQIHTQQNRSCCNTWEPDGLIHCGQRDGDVICSAACHKNCMLQKDKGYLKSATYIRQIPRQPNGFLGLFAGENIRQRDFIGEYCGVVCTLQEHERQLRADPKSNSDYATITKLGPKCVINAYAKGSAMCYANNSHNPNAEVVTIAQDGQYRQYLRALRLIPYGEEITIDYGWIWEETLGRRPTRCICNDPSCSGYLEKGYKPKRTLAQFWSGGQTSIAQPNTKTTRTQGRDRQGEAEAEAASTTRRSLPAAAPSEPLPEGIPLTTKEEAQTSPAREEDLHWQNRHPP